MALIKWVSFRSDMISLTICQHISDEVEFRWTGNKLFLPGDANLQVGEVYNRYMTGEMAHYYSGPSSRTKKAAGSQPPFSMAVELYVDKLKVIFFSVCCGLC
jgi:hypothetical protein